MSLGLCLIWTPKTVHVYVKNHQTHALTVNSLWQLDTTCSLNKNEDKRVRELVRSMSHPLPAVYGCPWCDRPFCSTWLWAMSCSNTIPFTHTNSLNPQKTLWNPIYILQMKLGPKRLCMCLRPQCVSGFKGQLIAVLGHSERSRATLKTS